MSFDLKALRQKIEQEICRGGPMRFSRYMELCLYDAELGFYSRNVEQFGKAGDFYTSSDVHAVFGRLLARQFEEMWRVLGAPARIEILELGPGRGLFARDVLDWSKKKFPAFFEAMQYSLLERSAALRGRLGERLEEYLARGKAVMIDGPDPQGLKAISQNPAVGAAEAVPCHGTAGDLLSTPAEPGLSRSCSPEVPLIVFANEFFDALPVEVLSTEGELHIASESGHLVETWTPASPEALAFLDGYSVQPEAGERIEAALAAQSYMREIAALVRRGFLLAIDYGYTRDEQLAGRHRGTLAAFRRHSMSANPYEAPGEQDITAHVNFAALAAAAESGGMRAQPLLTQSQFLLGIGEHNQFADAFEECRVPQERAKVALQLKHLITPAGMGESFHVLVASRGVDPALTAQLSGLGFGRGAR